MRSARNMCAGRLHWDGKRAARRRRGGGNVATSGEINQGGPASGPFGGREQAAGRTACPSGSVRGDKRSLELPCLSGAPGGSAGNEGASRPAQALVGFLRLSPYFSPYLCTIGGFASGFVKFSA